MGSYTSNLAILFPLGTSLYIAMRLSDGQVDGKQGGWARSAAYCIISLLIAFSLIGVMFRAGPISLVWLVTCGVVCIFVAVRSLSLNRAMMFQSLAMVRSNAACLIMARDFLTHNSWFVLSRARLMHLALSRGIDWSKAIQLAGIAKSFTERFACRSYAKYGEHLEDAVSPLLSPIRIQQEVERALARLYPLVWAVLGIVPLTATMWLVVPTFREMFEEFGIALPDEMQLFIRAADFFVENHLVGLAIIVLAAFAMIFMYICLAWVFPNLTQHHPLRTFTSPYFQSLGLTALAIALKHESNFEAACQSASQILPVDFISRRLQSAAAHSQSGQSPEKALESASLLSAKQSRFLQAAATSPSFPWALEQAAIFNVEKILRFYSLLVQMIVVSATFVLAIVYGGLAVAVITSLSKMILSI